MSWDAKRLGPVQPFRAIVTAHDPSDTDGSNVVLHDDNVVPNSLLDGGAYCAALYSHHHIPTHNSHSLTTSDLQATRDAAPDVVFPLGTNGRVTDLAPNFKVGYHRTSSVDYNIVTAGEVTLITPLPDGGEKRTLVKSGEVVIQRGTLHAWEAGPEGARWITVVVAAEPVKVGDKGEVLPDVDF